MTTPNSELQELTANQAQPHLTINSALRRIDALLQASYIAQQNAPPGTPAEGERYLIGDTPTGDWAGHPQEMAAFIGGAWSFIVPQEGWMVYLRSAGSVYVYGVDSPPTWTPLVTGGDILTDANWANDGDLVYGTGAGTAAILPSYAVPAGRFLRADPGGSPPLVWDTPPGAAFVPLRLDHFFSGKPTSGQLIASFTTWNSFVFNLSEIVLRARVPPSDTSLAEFEVRWGVPGDDILFGTIYMDSSGEGYGTVDGNQGAEPFGIGVGDPLNIYGPAVADTDLEDIAIAVITTEP